MFKLIALLSSSYRLFHLKIVKFSFVAFIAIFFISSLQGAYIPVYTGNANGGMSWTGNTLGLSKRRNQNQPGTVHSIGAFITTNTSLQVGAYPPGTTLDWTLNSSSATLDIPPGSTILHAELIWSGRYNPGLTAFLNTPVSFTPPGGVLQSIAPNPATAQSGGNFYVRSADVTGLVSGGGICTVAGVVGTVSPGDDNFNCAGWTLAVAYENPNMLSNNLTIFVAFQSAGSSPQLISGFTTPITGSVSSRLFLSALEGDVQLTGDSFLFGPTSGLSVGSNGLSGVNNPLTNFFCSQINTLLPLTTDVLTGKLVATGSSNLDTRGTFG